MSWSDEQVVLLRQMYASGSSYTTIGMELGYNRNAIAGKVFRLGLTDGAPERQEKPVLRRSRAKPEERFWSMSKEHRELPPHAAEPAVISEPKTINELKNGYGDCRWPLGDINAVTEYYCGKPALPGQPYCAEHSRMAHAPYTPHLNVPARVTR